MATTTRPSVDIEPILNAAVQKSGQKLDWRHSIVDPMKALGMDASLEERKELGYSGRPRKRQDEYLSPQGVDEETSGKRRQGACRPA